MHCLRLCVCLLPASADVVGVITTQEALSFSNAGGGRMSTDEGQT